MLLGVIADDFTGATDIAGFLSANGLQTVLYPGIPTGEISHSHDSDAAVIALQSRSCPPDKAVALSLRALSVLRELGCEVIYFKYCSTFDSTARGNIGPVTDALMDAVGVDVTLVCPALPANKRIVVNGELLVDGAPLEKTGMRHHPLNPMLDSNLKKLMEKQSRGKAEILDLAQVMAGPESLRRDFARAAAGGAAYIIPDSSSDAHLDIVAKAASGMKLLTGGSGLAAAWARLNAKKAKQDAAHSLRLQPGKTVVLAGSCSEATLKQVEFYKQYADFLAVSAEQCVSNNKSYVREMTEWVKQRMGRIYVPMLYASVCPERLSLIQANYGCKTAGEAVENFFASLAGELAEAGIDHFIVAGGETAGRVVSSLHAECLLVGPMIAPGVPWMGNAANTLYFALKSGNFGEEDFFLRAQRMLAHSEH